MTSLYSFSYRDNNIKALSWLFRWLSPARWDDDVGRPHLLGRVPSFPVVAWDRQVQAQCGWIRARRRRRRFSDLVVGQPQRATVQHLRQVRIFLCASKDIHCTLVAYCTNKNVFSDCLIRMCDNSPAVWSPAADCSRLEVLLHWGFCRRSWSALDWREAYESQPSAVFLSSLQRHQASAPMPGCSGSSSMTTDSCTNTDA